MQYGNYAVYLNYVLQDFKMTMEKCFRVVIGLNMLIKFMDGYYAILVEFCCHGVVTMPIFNISEE